MRGLFQRRYRSAWQVGILVLLTGWLYAPIALPVIRQCWQDPNYTYGLFVPAFSLLLLWDDRERLATLPIQPAWTGLVIALFALFALMVGVASSEFFLPRISLLLLIVGMIVFLAGWKHLVAVAFPLAFLVLMLPSATISSELTFPLQVISSKLATLLLMGIGVPAVREGNIILLQAARLGVTEACSGIRFLFSLVALSVIYGYFAESRISLRVVLALAAAPVSVLANALRIAATGFVVQYWGVARAEGTLHLFSGWLVFLGSLAMIFAFHRLLRAFFTSGLKAERQEEYA
ncbi:MAG TPA: exosortase/archaeosortase family protein [Terriglobales bacterium]|nr:exosortase/archaeosortase family protein [Terriglobales bacterium]